MNNIFVTATMNAKYAKITIMVTNSSNELNKPRPKTFLQKKKKVFTIHHHVICCSHNIPKQSAHQEKVHDARNTITYTDVYIKTNTDQKIMLDIHELCCLLFSKGIHC